ncbi:hypothetical protein TPB0596_28080 [Tsukamurella pulmonis]|uniref:Uncharacterized protein n=1 Tax=Tsukamurella pulmonis TaxID=47312 RepID=A0A1H1E658_9ACTN|nr:hypothetical protein [Tsukamurella pulmonis]BDD83045.1 hypothetical protein TPB0596_28080 [Tsukamurella pulmonis]SDQ84174.1 hypothetical protein SAMN04489765_2051 [Tsukamurella pulmonis]SUP21269.1 Uncharacterised protein [Tsukamurella pulmonis]
MFWKILGAIVVLWLALMVASAIIKSLFPLAVIALVVIGIVTVVKWLSSGKKSPSTF